jgi:molecular chaperone DnaK
VLGPAGAISLARPITASELEAVTGDLVARVVELGRAALADAHLDPAAIEAVVAVGGVTRAPSLRRAIAAMFPAPPARGFHPDETIAIGAALEGAILDGRAGDIAVVDRLARAIGFRAAPDRFVPVVPRAAVLPARTRKVFPTGGDPRKRIAFEIYEGNAAAATQNRRLGRVRLADPEPTDRVDHLEVVFTVDASGWLGITARDLRSGRPWSVERE